MISVLILTEGGREAGFGHITRCTALYQAFEERGIFTEFIVEETGVSRGFLREERTESCRGGAIDKRCLPY
jgi:spore coat polysaccharide biosynthesis predicted glycosyltransferase SpsG